MSFDKKEHSYIRIEKDMKTGEFPGTILLCGVEDYLTDHYCRTLAERIIEPAARDFDLSELTGDLVTAQTITETAETLPIMSRRKVVVIPRVVDAEGKLPKHLENSSKERDEFFKCLEEREDQAVIILSAGKSKGKGNGKGKEDRNRLDRLKKTVKKAGGAVYDFGPLDRDQLRNFAIKRFQKAGKTCSRGVLQSIVYDTGYGSRYADYDLYLLENDLKKMIAHSGNNSMVTEEDMHGILTISPENNVFHMLDAISRRRTDQALVDLNTLYENGQATFGILAIIINQLELILISREIMDEGANGSGTIQRLVKDEKINEFRAKNIVNTASRFRRDQLKDMLGDALSIEENIKSGLMDPRLALEYFIAQR